MILRSPLAVILSLAFVAFVVQCKQDTESPSVQECQTHIDAALKAFQHGHLSVGLDDEDEVQPGHITETNDIDEEDTVQSPKTAEDTHDDDDDDEQLVTDHDDVDHEDDTDEGESEDVPKSTVDDEDDDEEEEVEINKVETHTETEQEDEDEDDDDDVKVKRELKDEDEHQTSHDEDDEDIDEQEVQEVSQTETEDDEDVDQPEADKSGDEDDEEATPNDDKDTEEPDEHLEDEPEESTQEEQEEETVKEEEQESEDESDKEEQSDVKEDDEQEQEVNQKEEVDDDDEADDSEKETASTDEDQLEQEEETKEEVESESEVAEEAVAETEVEEEEQEEKETGETETQPGDDEESEEEEVLVSGPGQLRSRDHIETILHLSEEELDQNQMREKAGSDILKELKKMYEGAVKPLEQLYQFKDISNRLLGDAEIFSKPMVVFMGPWSTGKSAIINYLLGTEYTKSALKTGAEPTSNTFNVIQYGDQEQVIGGTQLAADWAFSSLQKFGQGFLDRLRGRKLPSPILQKMTIVDTPGIIENRKASERMYPFNDAFQWFIDRADLIYIVFDPTKLDIGLEMEALFDQLKGRESQIRILLNKADSVKPQELMNVQGNILWNLAPLLGTANAPNVFVGSFWSKPYLPGSPATLFDAQEEAFLEDIHDALETQVENKVALTRRHAVRVRNHAKMVDCYLNTYYNHKSFFSNKRKVADDIVDNPQQYHIYEGMSTLTNVSRYDLPDPDIYKEFFSVHPLFDFKPLASTCSYFKGCPLDKLDITIAYDLPELVGKYHRILSNKPSIGGR